MNELSDRYNLHRFVAAQAPVYATVRDELRKGDKRTHWMWFVFPQIAGLGFSAMSTKYAISSLDEARAYLAHPLLGSRLIECTQLVGVSGRSVSDIFGSPDDMKFRSSMTLFAKAQPSTTLFDQTIQNYCGGRFDPETLARI